MGKKSDKPEPKKAEKSEPKKTEKPEPKKAGDLWAASNSVVTIQRSDAEGGNADYPVAEDAEVTLNGIETTLDDLKRGDVVTLEYKDGGEPATKVAAVRE